MKKTAIMRRARRGNLAARWSVNAVSKFKSGVYEDYYPSWTGHDVAMSWQNAFGYDRLVLTGGVLNVTDSGPPILPSAPRLFTASHDALPGRTLFLSTKISRRTMMAARVPLATGRPPKPVINARVAPLLARGHASMTSRWARKCSEALAGGLGRYLRLTAVAAAAWVAAGAAAAGDDYLRGGIGFDQPGDTAFTDVDCASSAPAALYGCGRDSTGFPRRSLGDFGTSASLEFGLGHDTGSAARLEYRPSFTFEGRANFLAPDRQQSVVADLSSVSAMLAGFVDLDEAGLPETGPFVPFIGIGAARTRIGTTTMTFPATMTIVAGSTDIDIAWRYADFGEVHTGPGGGQGVWRDGSREPLLLDLAPTRARLAGHGIRLSLRRSF